ncbi:MAG: CRTAC1 family protein [Planctomycetes bacterium]|nr:CRTAC1 family protein [Planctomycetota bacterium]
MLRPIAIRWLWLASVVLHCGATSGCRDQVAPMAAQKSQPSSSTPTQQNDSAEPAFGGLTAVGPVSPEIPLVAPSFLAFDDQAESRGLRYTWPDQPRPLTALESFGIGCATFDADNDGWQDVLLVGNPVPAFFHNRGNGQFEDQSAASGLQVIAAHWIGVAIADYDADGWLDVLLTGYRKLALYKNVDGLHFQDVTAAAGLDPNNGNFWGSSAGFMDLDGDGWLDLVTMNYVVLGPDTKKYCEYAHGIMSGCGPRRDLPEFARIWRNTGHRGFHLVPAEQTTKQTQGVGLVLAFTDLDDDGRMDIYLGNDGVPADLLRNQGNFRFENIATLSGVSVGDNGQALSAMGADWGDFDRDGRLDLVVTNWFDYSAALFQCVGDRLYVDSAKRNDLARLTRTRLGWGAKWIDFENDGWLDLFIVNGHVLHNSTEIHGAGVPFRQVLELLWNSEGQRFVDVVPQLSAAIQEPMLGRGSATADFDNDGRVDMLGVDLEGPVRLIMNGTRTANHWLKFDLRGKHPNLFAYGARIVGRAGDQQWISEVSPASSYLSSSDPRIHWGLGELPDVESVTIRWPSGQVQTLEHVAADQILRINEPAP